MLKSVFLNKIRDAADFTMSASQKPNAARCSSPEKGGSHNDGKPWLSELLHESAKAALFEDWTAIKIKKNMRQGSSPFFKTLISSQILPQEKVGNICLQLFKRCISQLANRTSLGQIPHDTINHRNKYRQAPMVFLGRTIDFLGKTIEFLGKTIQ